MVNSLSASGEARARPPDGGVIVMWRHVDEPELPPADRWRKEHPGHPDAAGLKVIILRWSSDDEIGAWRETNGRFDAE